MYTCSSKTTTPCVGLAVIKAAERNAPALLQQTKAVANKFMQAFGRCHRIYDSAGLLSNMALTELGMAGHCSHKVYTCTCA